MTAALLVLASVVAGAAVSGVVFYLVFFSARKNEAAERIQLEHDRKLQLAELESIRRNLSSTFEILAQQVLDKSSEKLRQSGEQSLKTMLDPLRERLQEFQRRVEESYSSEARERFHLQKEIEKIVQLNAQMSEEANNLTRALKGDSKLQGNWGEIVLDRILQASGLREGEEYVAQARDLGLSDEEGRRLKPDIVVNLPEQKHVIIDSKVTLKSYEQMVNSNDDKARARHLKEFEASLYKHVDELAQRHYQALGKLNSPDFVMLFVPIEAAFAVVMQSSPDAFAYAWDRRIVIVSPTTLFATLRTVASIWRTERQNKNALEIARQGGALYDKFVSFVGDLQKLGSKLDDAKDSYQEAMAKLRDGKGNLLARVENLKELGAKTSKRLAAAGGSEDDAAAAKSLEASPKEPAKPRE